MRMTKIFAGGAATLVAAAIASLSSAHPASDSYCTVCGTREETKAYTLRFTALTLFQAPRLRPTTFSALLLEKRLVGAHQHHWEAPHFVPDPLDEFGAPVLQSLEFINAPRVLNFMRNVADYADRDQRGSVARDRPATAIQLRHRGRAPLPPRPHKRLR